VKDKAVLISIRPKYIELIVNGEKRLEFRRNWAVMPVSGLIIYACAPLKKIVAVAEIKTVIWGSRTKLWNAAKNMGGGVSRQELFAYLDGKKNAVAIELVKVQSIEGGLDPKKLFGHEFRPPQSFRYIDKDTFSKIKDMIKKANN
jgi:predicted transcriptional regulator